MEALTLQLAQQAVGLSSPNPRVGCVITDANGTILGQGHTQAPGQAHAEAMALQHAHSQGHSVKGATAWVSLEPCSHYGRTPPCCQALIQAQVAQVIVAVQDPNPLVAGKGLQALRQAGIEVHMGSLVWAQAAAELNIGFFLRMQRQRPYVRLKIAASLDGITALRNGTSQWITSPAARADSHAWRHRACAILTGIGTVLHDNPRLDVRLDSDFHPDFDQTAAHPSLPLRVVLDSHLRTPVNAKILQAPGRTLIYTLQQRSPNHALLAPDFAQRVEIVQAPPDAQAHLSASWSAQLDWRWILENLGQRQINELHIEAGHTLNGSLLRAGWVDEVLLYLAPSLLGSGFGIANLSTQSLQSLTDGIKLHFLECTPIGPVLRIRARIPSTDSFQFIHTFNPNLTS